MTAKTPHKEAGAGVKTKKMTGAVPGHDRWRRGARLLMIRDVSLFVEVRGQGYPLLVMHGGPSADHFTMLPFRQCADQITVILYDHRCNGRSVGAPVSSMTWENLTADAEALRQKLGFERWAVLGHSFGGHVALEYALRYPASLSHLVLLNTGGDARWEQQNAADLLARRGYSPQKAELVRRWFNGELTPREYFPMFTRIGDVYHTHFGPWLARDLIHGAWRSKIRPEALIFAGRDLLKGWTVMDRLGEIKVPMFVPQGTVRLEGAGPLSEGGAVRFTATGGRRLDRIPGPAARAGAGPTRSPRRSSPPARRSPAGNAAPNTVIPSRRATAAAFSVNSSAPRSITADTASNPSASPTTTPQSPRTRVCR